jgi:hypothetical protein
LNVSAETILQSRLHLDLALLPEDLSVIDLLVVVVGVVVVSILTPASLVHQKDLKNPRPLQSSTKNWMRSWEMLMLLPRGILLLLFQLLEMLTWLERVLLS